MGSSSSKDSRDESRSGTAGHVSSHPGTYGQQQLQQQQQQQQNRQQTPTRGERLVAQVYGARSAGGRGSRNDVSFLTLNRDRDRDGAAAKEERPRETKQEREARRAERERQARLKERERSIREEAVDGGYLVTLGTYTGPEDFDKRIVRQLQIERRLAPFWKGLNDHSTSWAEHQLVAAVRGLPVPAADEVPPEVLRSPSPVSSDRASDAHVNGLTVPISSRSQSYESSVPTNLSASHPAFSSVGPASSAVSSQSTAQLFRGRAKTLASLASGNKNPSPDLSPQEVRLPGDGRVNGHPIEAYLYKDASECPICFLYYPPYLNKTRCCDQPICSECFVQIKRPDPHPPEHEQPGQPRPPEEEAELLVSEVASCPFCVTPEFGVSYEPPSFRRGIVYANHSGYHPLKNPTSAMSSSSSLVSGAGRRRATSLSANSSQVITVDRVRPDWAKKLADARAQVLRRSAAATALHNAAYLLGNQGDAQLRAGLGGFGRRRRTLLGGGDSPGTSGAGTPGHPEGRMPSAYDYAIRITNEGGEDGSSDLFPNRGSSRRTRVDDLEDLMMMEAIRQSLAAEEDRKRKEEKEVRKDAKRRSKEAKKEAKQAGKLAKKGIGGSAGLYQPGANDSTSTWATTSMARSTSNLGGQPSIPPEQLQGKGKAPAQDFAGFHPLLEPTSTLNTEMNGSRGGATTSPTSVSAAAAAAASTDPQKHLEESRANLRPPGPALTSTPNPSSTHARQLSNASSTASSFVDSASGSLRAESSMPSTSVTNVDVIPGTQTPPDASGFRSGTPPAGGTPGHEPVLNFRSLAAMIGEEDRGDGDGGNVTDDTAAEPPSKAEEEIKEPSPTGSPRVSPVASLLDAGTRSRGDSGESGTSAPSPPRPIHAEQPPTENGTGTVEGEEGSDQITPAPPQHIAHDVDEKKNVGDIKVLDHPTPEVE